MVAVDAVARPQLAATAEMRALGQVAQEEQLAVAALALAALAEVRARLV